MSRNLLFSTISAGSAVLLLALATLIAHALGQDGFGQFSFALSLAMIGEPLMDFGIHQITIRSIARDRSVAPHLFRNSLALKALPGAAMFVVLGVFVFLWEPGHDLRIACLLMLGSAVLRSYVLTVRGVLQGLERFPEDSAIVVADRVLLLAAGAIALKLGAGLVGLAIAFVVARTIALAGAVLIARPHVGSPVPAFDTSVWWDLQRRAMPLGAFLTVLSVYSYIDTIILHRLTTDVETGLYNSAYRIYEGLSYAPAIISSVLTPRLSNLWKVDRAAHRALLRTGFVASLALAGLLTLAIWMVAPFALRIFPDAQPAAMALRILGLGLGFVFAIWILHALAISVFEERRLFQTTVIGAIANILLNFWLIPRFGRNGAAIATVAGEALTMCVLWMFLRRAMRPAAATS
jgi:PST family polysaccharide transporter